MKRRGVEWDEPSGAASPRGWLSIDGICVGFYLDYGTDHYRSPHSGEYSGRKVVWCSEARPCREHQPGNILACRYPNGPGTHVESRYVETVKQAREFVETGKVAVHSVWMLDKEHGARSNYAAFCECGWNCQIATSNPMAAFDVAGRHLEATRERTVDDVFAMLPA